MTNRDLLKEAIADAKAVKETAIANAKAALEESFTPHLKSMLAAKLEEMDKDEEVEENVELDEMDAPSFKRKSGASLDPDPKKVGQTTVQEEEEGLEEEELDLDEILNELDLSEENEDKEKMNEAEEDEAEEAEAEEAEDEEMEEEEIDLEDMSEDDLKSFIEDVIKDMVEAGELEAGDEMESEDEESEEDMEVEVEDDMEDIMEVEEGFSTGVDRINPNAENALTDLAKKFGKNVADYVKSNFELGSAAKAMASESEMEDAIREVNKLKAELQEVNLLNAKLLYTNKIFKAKNLTEDKKLRVLKAFDKAETVKEAKVIFETLNEGIESKSTRPTVNADVKRGMASKVTGMVTESKKPIIEVDPMVARWQKLAGLK